MMLGGKFFFYASCVRAPTEGGSGHQKTKTKTKTGMGIPCSCLLYLVLFLLRSLLPAFFFFFFLIYIPFVPVMNDAVSCCWLCVCTTAQAVAGDKRRWPFRLNPTDARRYDAKGSWRARAGERNIVARTAVNNRAQERGVSSCFKWRVSMAANETRLGPILPLLYSHTQSLYKQCTRTQAEERSAFVDALWLLCMQRAPQQKYPNNPKAAHD
ncbi:hypothetical protein GGI35DRAFT_207430 [Trichoderma velutinum]